MGIITTDHSNLPICKSFKAQLSQLWYVWQLYLNVKFLESYSGKCVNVRLMTRTWGFGEAARSTAKPQIEFSGDKPRTTYLSLYFLFWEKENLFCPLRFQIAISDCIVEPKGETSLSFPLLIFLSCLLKSDKRISTHSLSSERGITVAGAQTKS